MNVLETLFAAPQYSLPRAEKEALLVEELAFLEAHHRAACQPYRLIQDSFQHHEAAALGEFPFLPVRLFKELDLKSVGGAAVRKVLTSSGTTSQQVSRIAVDTETSRLQTKALASIVTSLIGPKRLPMIIVDSRAVLQDTSQMSARAAGVVGLSNFGRDHFYALDAEMRLDLDGLRDFVRRHGEGAVLVFGFTYMIWEYLVGALARLGESIALPHGIVIHGGGWKKLQESAVSNAAFREGLRERCGIPTVHNYYGMVEQVGSICLECEHGFLHAPNFVDIVVRDPRSWEMVTEGSTGVIQTISVLPRSYPGHSLLTEDLGIVHGVDDCPCGRLGTRFTVEGRLPRAELRGCSDTHAYNASSGSSRGRGRQFFPERRELAELRDLPGEEFFGQRPFPACPEEAVVFLDALSAAMFARRETLADPELAALAYWLRRANLSRYLHEFRDSLSPSELAVPRGVALHIAPSNVQSIFLYSWALSLLAGNLNLVRIPQQLSATLNALLDTFASLAQEPRWSGITQRNLLLSYPRDDEFNEYLSRRADLRIIWGGDQTALHFRSLPAKPVTKDIIFGDKVSLAIVHSGRYLAQTDLEAAETARLFYNDAYQFDQMACSSPKIVYFVGPPHSCAAASSRFWSTLGELWSTKESAASLAAMDKLLFGYRSASAGSGAFPYGIPCAGPAVMRVKPGAVAALEPTCGGGFFFECFVAVLDELAGLIQPNTQTLTYQGFAREEMRRAGDLLCARGVDRIVPFGKALNFAAVWDGYVLLSELTRRVPVL